MSMGPSSRRPPLRSMGKPLERFCQEDWRRFISFLEPGQSQRWGVVARGDSYHGNTLGALSLTGRIAMRRPYLPLLIDFPHFPPPYCYRCPYGLTFPECELECARALEN